jgi:hypothetical protein
MYALGEGLFDVLEIFLSESLLGINLTQKIVKAIAARRAVCFFDSSLFFTLVSPDKFFLFYVYFHFACTFASFLIL